MHARWHARLLAGLAAPLALAGAGPAAQASAAEVSAAACPGWSIVPSPVSPGDAVNSLSSVTVLSPGNAYAAGVESDTGSLQVQPLLEHWDGMSWEVETSPLTPRDHLHIARIQASSPTNIWAVGGFRDNQGIDETLILHSDGTGIWKVVPSPSPSPTFNDLTSVRALSASDAWAVGTTESGSVNKTLILHWNGANWTQVKSPSPGQAGSNDELFGVAAASATSAFAVGNVEAPNGHETALILRLKNHTWVTATSPHPGTDSPLLAVSAGSAANAWAVGSTTNSGVAHSLALHWNGTTWKRVTSPGSGSLKSVAVTSASNAWALQGRKGALRWDGHKWQTVATPVLVGATYSLSGIAARSAGTAWAVGTVSNGSPPSKAFALHRC
jgi:hypothetical protein